MTFANEKNNSLLISTVVLKLSVIYQQFVQIKRTFCDLKYMIL